MRHVGLALSSVRETLLYGIAWLRACSLFFAVAIVHLYLKGGISQTRISLWMAQSQYRISGPPPHPFIFVPPSPCFSGSG